MNIRLILWKTAMKMQFLSFDNVRAESKNCHINLGGRNEQNSLSNCFSSAGNQNFFTIPQNIQLFSTISSHKELYKIQPVEFLITEHIFLKNQA